MLNGLQFLSKSLGLLTVTGSESSRFLRLGLGFLALAGVTLTGTSFTTPTAHAQELERTGYAIDDSYAFGDDHEDNQNGIDYAKAVREYRRNVAQNNRAAVVSLYNLGVAYYRGLGVFEDRTQAAEWWSKAAPLRHYPSQFYLARAFANGDGVEQNLVAAHVWYNIIATVRGDSAAREARNAIQNNLSPIQRNEAQRLAKQCLESEYEDCPAVGGSQ